MTVTESTRSFERASAVIPGGVNYPVRAFRAVGGTPRFMVRASWPYLWDADGTRYVDLVCSWGPMHCSSRRIRRRHLRAAIQPRRHRRPGCGHDRAALQRRRCGVRGVRLAGEEIACVIAEAAAGNMGAVPPDPGFNAALRELCHAHGALLVLDEVMTGLEPRLTCGVAV